MLRDISVRNLSVNLFGETYETPILIAPVGLQTIYHNDGEVGIAEVAAELGVPFILSTAASTSMEEVAKANGNGRRWYQLYWPKSDEVTISVRSCPNLRYAVSNHKSSSSIGLIMLVTRCLWLR
jgi:isopentenyl diphosphate isomerase/L-lactate dehydrogenase-like FMN-dependent dehydrogenase